MIREIRKKKCQIGLPRSEGSTRPELILVSIRVFYCTQNYLTEGKMKQNI